MGEFYGSVNFSQAKFTNGNFIPYHPKFSAQMNYSYLFNMGLEVSPKLSLASGTFTDILNSTELDTYIDLGVEFKYRLLNNLSITAEFNNLTNNKNYIYNGYKEKPMDIILGIDYRW